MNCNITMSQIETNKAIINRYFEAYVRLIIVLK